MCSLELEPATVWSEWGVQARKRHVCACCDAAIRPGEPYLRHGSLQDGDWYGEQMCAACWFAREEFADAHGQLVMPSYFRTALKDCFGGEAREFWTDEDRRWRILLAGIERRARRARTASEVRT